MYVKSMKIINFRNYSYLKTEFSPGFNIIYGDNAQGKTNIIEALFLCASGRSHRTSKDSELVKVAQKGYFVGINIGKSSYDKSIEISYTQEEKKKVRINEIPAQRLGNLMGNLNAVIFSPEDLLIIKEGPSERRRFIDIALCQLKPTYFYNLQQYNKILIQRNSLLKKIQEKRSLEDTLDIWNEKLIDVGSRIIVERHDFVALLGLYTEKRHKALTNEKELVEIKYKNSCIINKDLCNFETVKKEFKRLLERDKQREIIKGTTLSGPQRDDYEFYINGMELKLYGSQGQQRTAVLALKLAEIQVIYNEIGEYPILLLDDVMSELDGKRQEYLLKSLANIQTFITCTNKDFFNESIKGDKKFFNVINGEIFCH